MDDANMAPFSIVQKHVLSGHSNTRSNTRTLKIISHCNLKSGTVVIAFFYDPSSGTKLLYHYPWGQADMCFYNVGGAAGVSYRSTINYSVILLL